MAVKAEAFGRKLGCRIMMTPQHRVDVIWWIPRGHLQIIETVDVVMQRRGKPHPVREVNPIFEGDWLPGDKAPIDHNAIARACAAIAVHPRAAENRTVKARMDQKSQNENEKESA